MLQLREEKNRHYEEHLKSEEERLGLQARQLDREVSQYIQSTTNRGGICFCPDPLVRGAPSLLNIYARCDVHMQTHVHVIFLPSASGF